MFVAGVVLLCASVSCWWRIRDLSDYMTEKHRCKARVMERWPAERPHDRHARAAAKTCSR
jgi:hypothetical protein